MKTIISSLALLALCFSGGTDALADAGVCSNIEPYCAGHRIRISCKDGQYEEIDCNDECKSAGFSSGTCAVPRVDAAIALAAECSCDNRTDGGNVVEAGNPDVSSPKLDVGSPKPDVSSPMEKDATVNPKPSDMGIADAPPPKQSKRTGCRVAEGGSDGWESLPLFGLLLLAIGMARRRARRPLNVHRR